MFHLWTTPNIISRTEAEVIEEQTCRRCGRVRRIVNLRSESAGFCDPDAGLESLEMEVKL